jgi:NAD(P)H-dependent flavin oxidoreductase YrpB (nitropropane dioxygenase family)
VAELNLWKEQRGYAAQMEGDVVNGIITSGQCAAAIHDIPTVAELIERMWAQARGLLHDATASLDAVPAIAG